MDTRGSPEHHAELLWIVKPQLKAQHEVLQHVMQWPPVDALERGAGVAMPLHPLLPGAEFKNCPLAGDHCASALQ